MFGYTAVTFHGYMGWGTGTYFNHGYSLSEAFFFNNQSLVRELQQEFPDKANVNFEKYGHAAIREMAQQHKIRDRKLLGHLWDRDSVAFYGDPAWVARHRLDDPAWKVDWAHKGENVEITVSVLKDGTWGNRPLAIPFPIRLGRIRGVSWDGAGDVLITDDFALLPLQGERNAGDTMTLTFGAYAMNSPGTSASDVAVIVPQPSVASTAEAEDKPELVVVAPAEERSFRPASLGLSPVETQKTFYALRNAGSHAPALVHALQNSEGALQADVAYLIANMPIIFRQ